MYKNIQYCNLILFADDTTLYASHHNATYFSFMLQQDITNLNTWFKMNKLSLNMQKTSVMELWTHPSQKNPSHINKDNIPIPMTKSTTFLGVTIDNTLLWSDHINNIVRRLSINKTCLENHEIYWARQQNSTFTMCIYTPICHMNTVWEGNLTHKQRNNLEKIQKYCLRAIMKKPKTHHTDPLFKILRIMKIDEIYHFGTSKLGYMIKNKLVPKPITDMFHSFGKKKQNYNTRQKSLPNIQNIPVQTIIKAFCVKHNKITAHWIKK